MGPRGLLGELVTTRDLDTIFKAYDIRGTVPDQLDATIVPRDRHSVRTVRQDAESADRARHAGVRPRARRRVLRGRSPRGRRRRPARARVDRHDLLRRGPARRARRDAHGVAQPRRVQRHQAVPRGGAARRRRERARRDPGDDSRAARGWRHSAGAGQRDVARLARRLRRTRALVHRHRRAPAHEGGRRHRERDGRPHRPSSVREASRRARSAVPRARRHVSEPSGRPDPAGEPARPAGARRRARRRRRPRVRRRRRPRVPRRRTEPWAVGLDDDRDACCRRPRQGARRQDHLQPDLLEGGARGHPRARRRADPLARRALVHQAGHGRDRRRVRRRALSALLLPRQLPRRLGDHRHDVGARADVAVGDAAVRAAQAAREVRGLGRDQHPRR